MQSSLTNNLGTNNTANLQTKPPLLGPCRTVQEGVVEQLQLLDQEYPLSFIENNILDLKDIPSRPVLTREDERRLFLILETARKNNDDELAKTVIERLYEHNTRILVKFAVGSCKELPNYGGHYHFASMVDFFMKALQSFDLAENKKFSTHLTNKIIHYWADIRREEYRHIKAMAKYRQWLEHNKQTVEVPDDTRESKLFEFTVGTKSRLDPRSKAILIARFGLNGEKACTLREVGTTLGVSKERIRQIEKKALAKAAEIADELGIKDEN